MEKKGNILIEHVSCHKNKLTPEQKGNDLADQLANYFRILGESLPPIQYCTDKEERVLLMHNGKQIHEN